MSLKSKLEFSERPCHLWSGNDNHSHKNKSWFYLFMVVGTNRELANTTKLLQTQIREYWTIAPRSNTRLGSYEPQTQLFCQPMNASPCLMCALPSSTLTQAWMKHLRHMYLPWKTHHSRDVLRSTRHHVSTELGSCFKQQNHHPKHKNAKDVALNRPSKGHCFQPDSWNKKAQSLSPCVTSACNVCRGRLEFLAALCMPLSSERKCREHWFGMTIHFSE